MSERAAYFLADAHLGNRSEPSEAARQERLVSFLNSLAGRAESLYVMGDLFDFWFEYRTAVPRHYFPTLCALRHLCASGVAVTYLAGNHDFWLGSFLTREIGVRPHEGALSLERDGRRIWIHHGDGLIRGDLGYRVLKRVIRHPWSIALYGCIHPDLGFPLAHWVSRWSRRSRGTRPLDFDLLRRQIAEPRFAEGFDAVLIGHFHRPHEHRAGGREFFVLGDWIEQFHYLVLDNGEFRSETWPAVR